MNLVVKILILLFIVKSALYSSSVYTLSGVKAVHPVVKIKTKILPKEYKKMIKEEIKENLDYLKINHTANNKKIFSITVSSIDVKKDSVININLSISEQVKRLDSKSTTFAATYISKTHFTLSKGDDLEDKFEDALGDLFDKFIEQYEEENKKVKLLHINQANFAQEMKYKTSYSAAIKKAKRLKKDIMFFVVSSHCPWCRKFEQRVLLKKDINEIVQKNYIPLILNKDKDIFPKKYNKSISPIIYFIDHETLEGYEMIIGYNNKDEFLYILKNNAK